MSTKFTQSFKIQAVEKALNRTDSTGLEEVANSLGIGYSTLQKWIVKSRKQEFELRKETANSKSTSKEKRPQDWSLKGKLDLVIACGSLVDADASALCREKGLYPHHVKQWKSDFAQGSAAAPKANMPTENKQLKSEILDLQKELRRKDKALAETAALLVLQKKSGPSGETKRTTDHERGATRHSGAY